MAHLGGETSNALAQEFDDLSALFDTLADWNKQLQHIEIEFEEPQP
ncbi:hypothetical protein [Martelella radicis]|uniref:Uncharacterized protein n=1 Tax=Martelella radicis TaxID=1397476 RepID=A0A7W6PD19_9HYPH|nr:hypothetical protein [Martelella radicis]MBB4123987.1 hypothetical protein [Martelella radicis]